MRFFAHTKGRREKERERKRKGKEEEGKEKGKGERERETGSEVSLSLSPFPFSFPSSSFPFLFLSLSFSLRPFRVCAKKRIFAFIPLTLDSFAGSVNGVLFGVWIDFYSLDRVKHAACIEDRSSGIPTWRQTLVASFSHFIIKFKLAFLSRGRWIVPLECRPSEA